MYKAIVFAGTTEGYEICRFLSANKISIIACVATEYGSHSLEAGDYLKIQAKRLDEQEMTELFHKELPEFILDATHPYATEVTKNIKSAALASGISYIRVLRAESQSQNAVYVETAEQAVEYLRDREGRIFLTTGSKELAAFTTLPDYRERIYARVLSLSSVVEACQRLGFEGKHLIAMQGPFSKEMNEATIRQYDCQYIVTKDSGKAGGFQEKIDAAFACGAVPIIIGRPAQEEGISLTECKRMLAKHFSCEGNPQITTLGIGMGSEETLTIQGKRAVEKADLIIGARRIADAVALPGQEVFYEYRSREIVDYIQNHPEYSNIVVALSGDVGFYSGARKLVELFGEVSIQPEIICGISSVVYFMSKKKKEKPKEVLVRNGNRTRSVSADDIYYIESSNRKVTLYLRHEKIEYYDKISSLESELKPDFFRIHKGYLVNIKYVERYDRTEVKMRNGDSLLISKYKYQDFVKRYLEYISEER